MTCAEWDCVSPRNGFTRKELTKCLLLILCLIDMNPRNDKRWLEGDHRLQRRLSGVPVSLSLLVSFSRYVLFVAAQHHQLNNAAWIASPFAHCICVNIRGYKRKLFDSLGSPVVCANAKHVKAQLLLFIATKTGWLGSLILHYFNETNDTNVTESMTTCAAQAHTRNSRNNMWTERETRSELCNENTE